MSQRHPSDGTEWHFQGAAAKVSAACCINALRYAKKSSSEQKKQVLNGVGMFWRLHPSKSVPFYLQNLAILKGEKA
jgi:hypothetical protein